MKRSRWDRWFWGPEYDRPVLFVPALLLLVSIAGAWYGTVHDSTPQTGITLVCTYTDSSHVVCE